MQGWAPVVMEDEGRNTPSPPPLLTWWVALPRLQLARQTCHACVCALQLLHLKGQLSRRQWQHQRESSGELGETVLSPVAPAATLT